MWFRPVYGPAPLVCLLLLFSTAAVVQAQAPAEQAATEAPVAQGGWRPPDPVLDNPDQVRAWAKSQEREAQAPPATAWGIAGIRGFIFGQQTAPNGFEYSPLFSIDFDFNLMLWREHNVYLFTDVRFWGQKPGGGNTNPTQGVFDFSKRELDFDLGLAWNYYADMEARVFSYSAGNLNRGKWQDKPSGFNDGIGLENRWYIDPTYYGLGTAAFDAARATFISIGDYPSKDIVDNEGFTFKPGVFARAYLTYDLWEENCYLYLDAQLTTRRPINPKLMSIDGGAALRPFPSHPHLEFRLGSEDIYDRQWNEWETSLYVAVRYVY
jgi:hypothetical protein